MRLRCEKWRHLNIQGLARKRERRHRKRRRRVKVDRQEVRGATEHHHLEGAKERRVPRQRRIVEASAVPEKGMYDTTRQCEVEDKLEQDVEDGTHHAQE